MRAATKTTVFPLRQTRRKPIFHSTEFLDEDLASVPLSGVPEEFLKLSRFLPMIVLVPRSAVHDGTRKKDSALDTSVANLTDTTAVSSPLDAARAWFKQPSAGDTFGFGEVTVCFSTMEIHRHGQPVILTSKEFKTLAYLIKNPRKVISRDELLNEVWGYQSYPCTRTVDNHILRLRKKLEGDPTCPKHFHTIHGSGYKFLP
jgi:DNA-binding response OmpR family regulator